MFDKALFNFIHQFSGQFGALDFVGLFLAEYLAYFLIIATIFFFFRYRPSFIFYAFLFLNLLLSRGLLTDFLRLIYPHLRPFTELSFIPLIDPQSSFSFPSGHAAFFFSLAFSLWLANKKWGIVFFIAALLMGIARVFVGVHWPLDIIGGFLVSLLSVIIIKWILRLDTKSVKIFQEKS